jgi:hypothetical protein
MPRLSISTWSLHRNLGAMYKPASDGSGLVPHNPTPGSLSLLEVPAAIASRGIGTLEICHFHFPRTDDAYIQELKAAIKVAGVELFSILIDTGDITAKDNATREREVQSIKEWLVIAGQCGASHARVIAGDAEASPEAIQLSADNLRSLSEFAGDHGVKVITENFRPLTRRAATVLEILDRCEGKIGLCADFGNFSGPTKYDDLAAILPFATSAHAKAHYGEPGKMEREDFIRCMDLSRDAKFGGPYSLIFDGAGDEWQSIGEIKEAVVAYL